MGISSFGGCYDWLSVSAWFRWRFRVAVGRDLVFGSSVADIKKKIEERWGRSIGRSYTISFVDDGGNGVIETYVPKLVKVRSRRREVENVVGQLLFEF
jgi:hypothetical protein